MIKIGSSTLLLLALFALQLPSSFCQDWWSVTTNYLHARVTLDVFYCRSLVTQTAVINRNDVTSPKTQTCPNSTSFDGILCGNQIDVCRRDDKLLSTIAIGMLRSLNVCQRLFKDRAWNCSVFDTQIGPYLGNFINRGVLQAY